MSTILEALKKSEQERKQNKVPTLSDMQAPQEPSRWPMRVAIISCLLALACLILLIFMVPKGETTSAQAKPLSEPAKATKQPSALLVEEQDDDILVNVISFSDDLSQRFAMVDGKMVREGEFVRAGLMVEQINPDSVVFNFRGKQISRKP